MKTLVNFRNAVLATLVVLTSLSLNAQNKKEYSLKGFDGLEFSSAFVIDVTKGSTFKVMADAEREEDLEDLEVAVRGGKLIAKYRDGNWKWNKNRKRVTFTVVMPTVKSIDFSGATKSKVAGFDDLENISMEFSGASSSELSLSADKATIDLSGASKVKLTGKASKLNLDASGASHLDASNFLVRDADIETSGASHVKINSSKSLNVDASGASHVSYKGGASVRKDISGASSVRGE
jgi:hypothetical protein